MVIAALVLGESLSVHHVVGGRVAFTAVWRASGPL
jgi:hypothetical protein